MKVGHKFKEKLFVEKFIECMALSGVVASAPENASNQSTYADCEMLHGNIIIKMEAKLFDDPKRNSGEFHKMFGELIAMRNKKSLLQENKDSKLGILIPEDKEDYFVRKWKRLSSEDARQYCEMFSVRYLVLFNSQEKKCIIKKYQAHSNNWEEELCL